MKEYFEYLNQLDISYEEIIMAIKDYVEESINGK